MCIRVCHSPLFAIDLFSSCCSNYGTYEATEHPWHGMQVVDATCILELEPFLQKGLRKIKSQLISSLFFFLLIACVSDLLFIDLSIEWHQFHSHHTLLLFIVKYSSYT